MNRIIKTLIIAVLGLFFAWQTVLAQNEATSSNEIREKVQQKVTDAMTQPKAYIGTITDISGSTIQITRFSLSSNSNQEAGGEIQQISTSDDTSYVNIGKESNETLEFSEVAIGDFIVSMGYKNGNEVLEAKRVLVMEPIVSSQRQALRGSANELATRDFVLKKGDENVTVEFGKSWKGPDLNEIEEGQDVIVVGSYSGDTFEARTIKVLEESQTPAPEESPAPSPES